MASSSSWGRNLSKYQVYINFGESEIGDGFLSHLYPALKSKQIDAFIDTELERVINFTENLFRLIEQSDLSIVIFSQNYPHSEWCLQELEKIHESMKLRNQIVVPVFYEVDPSDVQDLKGNYAIQKPEWRDALVEISNLSGFDSRNSICGFAKCQEALSVNDLLNTLDTVDTHLASSRYLCGDKIMLADICLFTTLIRFDPIYNVLFKCTKKKLLDYPNRHNYMRDIYQIPKAAETCNFTGFMDGYYRILFPLNPGEIRPVFPTGREHETLSQPHNRKSLQSADTTLIPSI